ncbi:MAG: isoprenylcysteine carboxylmethyltransferase family protein [Bryobacterales bacterium]|nr:isoprenylcysteine carboxylmethyltransferase family protein [Bryobacteraceae bacterium]MDW8353870.1 isoprenylcysteine carboxylmethyltransferase family protein [Bryobacterales bacterium]
MRRRPIFPKPYADFVARLRVPAGFVLAGTYLWLANPTPESLWVGLPLAALGVALRAWAAGHLAKNERLATTGPYAYVRNPLYLGTLVAAAGLVVASRRLALALVFAAVFAGVYLPVIELEEQHLRKLFPSYASYAERVPMLRPRLRPYSRQGRFEWMLYRRNQEYQALAAFLAAALFLVGKVVANG